METKKEHDTWGCLINNASYGIVEGKFKLPLRESDEGVAKVGACTLADAFANEACILDGPEVKFA